MRVVLDTNVYISGIFWHGPAHEIIQLAKQGKIEIAASNEIIRELVGVLQRDKFKLLFQKAETTLSEVLEQILALVNVYDPIVKVHVIKEDPDDNKFLACALSAQASYIVSGDQHLLGLKDFQNILIVNPREFLESIYE